MGQLAKIFDENVRSTKDVVASLMARAHANGHVAETQTKICQSYQKVADLVEGGSMSPAQVRAEREANIELNKSGFRAIAWANNIAEEKGSKTRLIPTEYLSDTVTLFDPDAYEIN